MREIFYALSIAVVLILVSINCIKKESKEQSINPPLPIQPIQPIIPSKPEPPKPQKPDTIEKQLIEAHNQIRKNNGKSPLQEDPKLNEIAQKWANHMATTGRMYHQALRFGSGFMGMGENIAMGQRTVDEVMKSWMSSRGHRNNILGNYSHIGVGIAKGNKGTFWCVDFGKKNGGSMKLFLQTTEYSDYNGKCYASSIHN